MRERDPDRIKGIIGAILLILMSPVLFVTLMAMTKACTAAGTPWWRC